MMGQAVSSLQAQFQRQESMLCGATSRRHCHQQPHADEIILDHRPRLASR
jgi:hypothetical protein